MTLADEEIPRPAVVRLVRFGFEDGARAARLLSDPALGLWDLERNEPADPEAGPVVAALARAGDPDLALRSLHRLVEALDGSDPSGAAAAALLAGLRGSGVLRSRLLAVLGASSGLAEHLAAHPGDWTVLDAEGDGFARGSDRPSPEYLRRDMLTAVGADPDDPPWGVKLGKGAPDASPKRIAALRAAYRRAILSVAGRDLGDGLPAEEVAAELADTAAAVLTAGLALAVAEQPADAAPCRLAVIALGKTRRTRAQLRQRRRRRLRRQPVDPTDPESAALTSATRVAAALMRICHEAAWEVDAALRPEGKAGALVRTVAGHESYYRQWASTWEFQALLKMRPVAGDPDLGRAYVDTLWPLVWKAGDRPGFVADVQAMRRRVEANIPPAQAERELKLGRGGLRDVEFAVQLLQMVHGRADATLRLGGTLPALGALSAGGYVGRDDAATLIASYRSCAPSNTGCSCCGCATHLLPTDEQQLRWLARSLGYKPDHRGEAVDVLAAELALHTREVRRLHEKLFYRPLLSAVARVPGEHLQLGSKAAGDWLRALGFADPEGALRHLGALTSGISRSASMQKYLLPVLLQTFASCPNPDAGVLAYRQVSEALGGNQWFLRLLRDKGQVAERLAQLLGSSQYIASLLTHTPEALRLLADDAQLEPRSAGRWRVRGGGGRPGSGPARRHPGAARAAPPGAAADRLGRPSGPARRRPPGPGAHRHRRRHPPGRPGRRRAGVRPGGRHRGRRRAGGPRRHRHGPLGRREIGFGSDADVLFVHRPRARGAADDGRRPRPRRVAPPCAGCSVSPPPTPPSMSTPTWARRAQAHSSAASSAFREYYERWFSVWEVQALLRAVPVAGDEELGADFVALIDPIRYPAEAVTATRSPRSAGSRPGSSGSRSRAERAGHHTKLGRVGCPTSSGRCSCCSSSTPQRCPRCARRHGLQAPAPRRRRLLDAAEVEALPAALELAIRARNAIFLVRGRPSDQLPGPGMELVGRRPGLRYGPDTDSRRSSTTTGGHPARPLGR